MTTENQQQQNNGKDGSSGGGEAEQTPTTPAPIPSEPGKESGSTPEGAPKEGEPAKAPASEPDKSDSGSKDKPKEPSKDASAQPEQYELKMPDGTLLDASAKDRIASYAKEQGLSKEQAQSLLTREHEAVSSFFESQKQQHAQIVEDWRTQVKADKEIGGTEFDKNAMLAGRVIDRYGTPALKEALNATGYGNHPEFVRFCVRLAKASSDDEMVIPTAHGSGEYEGPEKSFYPTMHQQASN